MKNLLWLLVLGALTAFGAGKDIYGNNITNSTLIGNVDGELTTVGDINALKVETDPTVPSWAKTPEKPVYNAGEVGARPNNWMPSAADVGALPNNQDALVGNPNFSNAVISASGISTEASARAAGDAALDAKIATKQTNLVSGVNIKTINGESVLGIGNLDFSGMTPSAVTNIASRVVTNDVAAWALKPNEKPQGMSTNAVKSIINAEVGGTNTIVHSLAPALAYTDTASNNLATAIAEKRGLTDVKEYVDTYSWITTGLPAKSYTEGNPRYGDEDPGKGYGWYWSVNDYIGYPEIIPFTYRAFASGDETATSLSFSYKRDSTQGGETVVFYRNYVNTGTTPTEKKLTRTSATSGLAKLGADGVLTAATAADVPGLSEKASISSVNAKLDSDFYYHGDTYEIKAGDRCDRPAIWIANGEAALAEFVGYFTLDKDYEWSGLSAITNFVSDARQTLPQYLSSLSWCPSSVTLAQYGINDAYTKAEAESASTNAANAVYYANVTGDVQNISAPIATNAATSVFAEIADYALTNLATAAYTLRTSEIGNYETTANFTLTLQFADNGRSGDCLLYVANTDAAEDHTIIPEPASIYTFVSADLEKALSLGKATTNLLMFTRVNANTVLISKTEVK